MSRSSLVWTAMLTIVGGPMFAGKTTWLINYTRDLPKGSFAIFKPSIDTRYSKNECVTHDGLRLPAYNLPIEAPSFPKLGTAIKTILLDELNFLKMETLLPVLQKQLNKGRDVVGVGLLYDFEKKPFGATLPLSKLADEFIQLEARCDSCTKPANHSYRKIQVTDQVVLGASELYGACCEACWKKLSAAPEQSTLNATIAESKVLA